jgi:hypothetical protein
MGFVKNRLAQGENWTKHVDFLGLWDSSACFLKLHVIFFGGDRPNQEPLKILPEQVEVE